MVWWPVRSGEQTSVTRLYANVILSFLPRCPFTIFFPQPSTLIAHSQVFRLSSKKYTKSIQGSSKVGLRLTPRYDNVLSRPTPCNSRHAVKRIRALHLHHDHNRDGYSKSRRRKVQANNSDSPGPQLQTAAILRFATYMSITDFINLS